MVLVALPIDTTDPLVEGTGSLNLTSGFVSGRSEKNNKTFRTEESTEQKEISQIPSNKQKSG